MQKIAFLSILLCCLALTSLSYADWWLYPWEEFNLQFEVPGEVDIDLAMDWLLMMTESYQIIAMGFIDMPDAHDAFEAVYWLNEKFEIKEQTQKTINEIPVTVIYGVGTQEGISQGVIALSIQLEGDAVLLYFSAPLDKWKATIPIFTRVIGSIKELEVGLVETPIKENPFIDEKHEPNTKDIK